VQGWAWGAAAGLWVGDHLVSARFRLVTPHTMIAGSLAKTLLQACTAT
jgi:hypothetical protein